ncbi:MAG: hypothetical protein Q9218_001179 [Villophora microphyllina]
MENVVRRVALDSTRRALKSLQPRFPCTQGVSQGPLRHFLYSPRAQASLQSRAIHGTPIQPAQAVASEATQDLQQHSPVSTNPALAFPCLDAREAKTASLSARSLPSAQSLSSGPEPSYNAGQHETWHSDQPILLDWGGVLPEYNIAYETWGEMNDSKSNVILLHTGLSASSHAHSTSANPKPGWWEKFIGPGAPLDTDKYFVICTNVIGGCYGSTGPQSIDPANGRPYATRFPILTMQDMVRAQFRLLDAFGIRKLYASLGSSMGGMQSLAAGILFPDRVHKIVSVSGCARSHPYSIALRHTQRQVLMMDPNWSRGFYYDGIPPHVGMKLAREIATVTYRSGPEWEQRFGRRRADPARPPALCPDFLIETYLDHAGEKFCLEFDANSLLYVSKAMDLFDLGLAHQEQMQRLRRHHESQIASGRGIRTQDQACNLTLPEKPYEEQPSQSQSGPTSDNESGLNRLPADLVSGLSPLRNHATLVMGVVSDSLFPAWQQREVAETLRAAGNRSVTHVELGEDTSLFGHDTFLLDLKHIGGTIRNFLE